MNSINTGFCEKEFIPNMKEKIMNFKLQIKKTEVLRNQDIDIKISLIESEEI